MWLKCNRPKDRLKILIAAALIALAACGAAFAANGSPAVMRAPSNGAVDLIITIGTSYLLECQGLDKVAVGDPAVADVVPVSTSQLLVNAKAIGTTNMFVWDKIPSSRLRSYKVTIVPAMPDLTAVALRITADIGSSGIVARPAGSYILLEGVVTDPEASKRAESVATAYYKDVKNMVRVESVTAASPDTIQSLQEAFKGTNITVRALPDGTILIEGKVADKSELDRVNALLNGKCPQKVINLVQQVPLAVRQVNIHCQVIEVNRSNLKDVGVDWGRSILTSTTTSTSTATVTDQPFIFGEAALGPFNLDDASPIRRLSPLAARLNLLIQTNRAKVLSEPTLLVADGNKASILVGGEIPIPVVQSASTTGSSSVSVEWKEFGVRLAIAPRIGDNNNILLDVAPEVSNLDFGNAITFSGFVIPALTSRKAQSTIQVQNGQSLLIGGLMNSEDRKNIKRIPLLSKIPIIGEFFKTTSTDHLKTELVILVTPEIVEPGQSPSGQVIVSTLREQVVK